MNQIDFEHDSVRSGILQASLPMMAAQVLSLLYSIVDRMYIGRIPGVGTIALGGIGLCFPVVIIITAFANLCGFGGAPLCAMARGRGDTERAEYIMNVAFRMLLFSGIILTAAGYAFSERLLILLGASDETLPFALSYLNIYLAGTVPFMLATGLNPFINAQGFAKTGMLTVFAGAITNILLDPVFIFVLGMGIRGAALATVLSQLLSMAVSTGFLLSRGTELRLRRPVPRFRDLSLVGEISALGSVSFIMQATNSMVAIACNKMLGAYGGDLSISVYTIVSSVRQILELPLFSFANGSSPIMSYNYGAGHNSRLKEAIHLLTLYGCGYTMAIWILILICPAAFIRIFTADPELIPEAVNALHIYFFAFVFQSFQTVAQNTFKALGKKKQAIFFSLFRKAVLVVPLTLFLPGFHGLGVNGVFLAEPISNVLGGLASFTTMTLTIYRKLGKKRPEERESAD